MKKSSISGANIFDEKSIWKILFKIAPPVMFAQLIQAMYNIVDSFFVGKFSGDGLSALSVIYPIQLIITAIAVGTGVGVNTKMSRDFAKGKNKSADNTAGSGFILAIISWTLFTIISILVLKPYIRMSITSPVAIKYAETYGYIVCIGSLGIFLESTWSKVHQAKGNMKLPMVAQVAGALTNIILDPILIFGLGPFSKMGIAGAAYATIIGQTVAAIITISGFRRPPKPKDFPHFVKHIYVLGFPNIFMQMLFTVYIVVLNIILGGFADEAVTVLGLYYKLQSFFFIPLYGLQTCIVPLLSYTYAKKDYLRCKSILNKVMILSLGFMLAGFLCFELIPKGLLSIFASEIKVFDIGIPAFRIIGLSFFPAVVSLTMPVFFQAIGKGVPSIFLSLTRQIFCLIPIFWGLSKIDLMASWAAFPISEIITGAVGLILLYKQLKTWKNEENLSPKATKKQKSTMKMLVAIINKKDSDSVCKALSENGFYFTKTSTIGGFLNSANVTLLIGVEEEKVKTVSDIINASCKERTELTASAIPLAVGAQSETHLTTAGGATIFVLPVEKFLKI